MPSEKVQQALDLINTFTVIDLVDLSQALQERWGVSAAIAAAPTPGPAATGAPAAPEEAAEEQTEFSVVLSAVGPNKIPVIKVVRELTGLGLKEAKDLVDSSPKPVKEGVTRDQAEAARAKLIDVGATVDIT